MNKFKKMFSLALCILIIFTSMSGSFAIADKYNRIEFFEGEQINPGEEIVIYQSNGSSDHFVIKYQIDNDQNQYIKGYLNGKIIEEGIVYKDNKETIDIITYNNLGENYKPNSIIKDNSGYNKIQKSTLRISDYIDINKIELSSGTNTLNSYIGGILFARVQEPPVFMSVSVDYSTGRSFQSEYTIRNYVGNVVTLATAIIGALKLPAFITVNTITQFLFGLGVNIVGNVVVTAFSDKLSCIETPTRFDATDDDTGKRGAVVGAIYEINSEKSKHLGETYYSGYTRSDWRTSSLANAIAHSVYGETLLVSRWY